jgi:hypothetical protein
LIYNSYYTYLGKSKSEVWVNVDVHQYRPEEPMAFTFQMKQADKKEIKWRTCGKVVIIAPSNWGRLSVEGRKSFIKSSFDEF